MHDHEHPELAKKLNDKIPNTVDEMFERVIAYKRGSSSKTIRIGKAGLTEDNCLSAILRIALDMTAHHIRGDDRGCIMSKGFYIDGGSSSEIMYEHCFKNFDADIKSRLRKSNAPLVGFLGEVYDTLGLVDLRVTMGEPGRSKTVLLKFVIVKCRSPYNLIMGRTGMRSLKAVGSTIHLMIKFPTTRGVATVETSKEALIREQAILRVRSIPNQRPRKEPMMLEETWEEDTMKEKVIIHNPDHPIVINDKLSSGCKQKIEETLQKNVDVIPYRGRNVLFHLHAKWTKKFRIYALRDDGQSTSGLEWAKCRRVPRRIDRDKKTTVNLNHNVWRNASKCTFGMEEGKFLGYVIAMEGIRADLEKMKEVKRLALYCFLKGTRSKHPSKNGYKHATHRREGDAMTLITRQGPQINDFPQNPKSHVGNEGPMEEMLKMSDTEGRLAKWAVELRIYHVSYVRRKEAEVQVVKKSSDMETGLEDYGGKKTKKEGFRRRNDPSQPE
ncbi:hypothetical protein Tco_0546578 [Tanacetum coccineum]